MIYVTNKHVDQLPPDAITASADGITFIKTEHEMNLQEAAELGQLHFQTEKSYKQEYRGILLLGLCFYVIAIVYLIAAKSRDTIVTANMIDTMIIGYITAVVLLLYRLYQLSRSSKHD